MKNFKDVKKVALLLKVFSILILAGVLTYVIYNYVKNGNVDVWCLCICIFIAIVVAFGAMALCDFLEKKLKQKWISNFSLGFSMILGMLAAVIAGLIG